MTEEVKIAIDDVVAGVIRPDSINWTQPQRLGTDGLGSPVRGAYWSCRLAFSRMTTIQFKTWYDAYADGQTHTVRLPHPSHGVATNYTCYVSGFSQRVNTVDPRKAAASGVDVTLSKILVTL